jgi:polyisoprenoid-binding protein YceI
MKDSPLTKRSLQWLAASALLAHTVVAVAQQQAIDPARSTMTVHVGKTGAFSAFGHNHEIAAPIDRGSVDAAAQRVELRLRAEAFRLRDSDVSEKDRGEIQSTMLGPQVLDVRRYPEIVFRSTRIDSARQGSWKIQGDLTLHGQTRPVAVAVNEREGHYIGSALLKQTDFGITPVRVAGGTVRVKDQVRVEFDVQLVR